MTARKKVTPRPEPVVVKTICSLCGLPWEDHKVEEGADTPSSLECIRLLKVEVASKEKTVIYQPYPQPYTYPIYPYRAGGYYDQWGIWRPYTTWNNYNVSNTVPCLNTGISLVSDTGQQHTVGDNVSSVQNINGFVGTSWTSSSLDDTVVDAEVVFKDPTVV